MALSDFLTALKSAPADIQAIDKALGKLYAERDALKKAPLHIDDIKAWALKGLDTASEDFIGRLKRWHFNDAALAGWYGETLDGHSGPQLLGITSTIPHGAGPGVGSGSPDLAAITHFLRPAIEAALPKLIEESFPGSRNGMRSADRNSKLTAVEKKIAALEASRAELKQAVQETVRHLDGAQYAANQASPGEQYDGGPILDIGAN